MVEDNLCLLACFTTFTMNLDQLATRFYPIGIHASRFNQMVQLQIARKEFLMRKKNPDRQMNTPLILI